MERTEERMSLNEVFLKIQGLTKSYGEGEAHVTVLDGVDVSIDSGELCVLLGPSGSGKSTFLNLIGGLEHSDEGSIVVNGTDITQLNDKGLGVYRRDTLGFVFQFYNLIADLTVRENIEVCQQLSSRSLDVNDLLHSLGLWEQRDKFPRQISGGQQQRCSIGRALVKNPSLLLCDEPTGALDYEMSKEILALIERVKQEHDCTIMIVTHNDAISLMADRTIKLREGKIVENIINEHPIAARDLTW